MQRVFDKQKELIAKFGEIEKNNGYSYVPEGVLDLDDPRDQLKIKELFGRVYEELAEAQDAQDGYSEETSEAEMIDALHFLTELTIHLGYDWFDFEPAITTEFFVTNDISDMMYHLYKQIGLTTNALKNRPWKQSMKPTDKEKFFGSFFTVWQIYFDTMYSCFGYTLNDIIKEYLAKHQVNLDRIEDGK